MPYHGEERSNTRQAESKPSGSIAQRAKLSSQSESHSVPYGSRWVIGPLTNARGAAEWPDASAAKGTKTPARLHVPGGGQNGGSTEKCSRRQATNRQRTAGGWAAGGKPHP